jgi:hypothetical protein
VYKFTFLETWTVDAPIASVFANLSDFNKYPQWGAPAYLAGWGDPPNVGSKGTVVLRGALPYKLKLDCTIVELAPPSRIVIDAFGDLVGRQVLTLTALGERRTRITSDWRANTRWAPLTILAPVLRPLFRWNHHKCTEMAYSGLAKFLGAETAAASEAHAALAT